MKDPALTAGSVRGGFLGSGFWYDESDPKALPGEEWRRIGDYWADTVVYHAIEDEIIFFAYMPSNNGTWQNYYASLKITTEGNNIRVRNIAIGDKQYDNVDKHVATRMFNGVTKGRNSETNRYTAFVGDSLDVSAKVGEGYSFVCSRPDLMTEETSAVAIANDQGELNASFLGLEEGNCEIQLMQGQTVVERSYVHVQNPMFVNTSIGEYSKDAVHEYVGTALGWMNDDIFITDPDGNRLYVRNLPAYMGPYAMYEGEEVELVVWVSEARAQQTPLFTYSTGIEAVSEADISEFKPGFKKVIQRFRLKNNAGIERIEFGEVSFYIQAQANTTDGADHFDIEVAEGGTYTIIATTKFDDRTVVTEWVYKAQVSGVNSCVIYGDNDTKLGVLDSGAYWNRTEGFEGDTQYEFTSAYVTDGDGHPVGDDGQVIDQDVLLSGNASPKVAVRDEIKAHDIRKVVFDVKLDLEPYKCVVTTKTFDDEGNEIEVISEESFSTTKLKLNGILLEMNAREIVDAYNKCPNHSGYDFTTAAITEVAGLTVAKTVTGTGGDRTKLFTFTIHLENEGGNELTGQYTYFYMNTVVSADTPQSSMIQPDSNGNGSGKLGNGDEFTLKHGQSIVIVGLPDGTKYTVTEAKDDNYITSAVDDQGQIINGQTVAVSFVNHRDQLITSVPKNSLSISKTVAGSAGDKTKEFHFIVELKDIENNLLSGEFAFEGGVLEDAGDNVIAPENGTRSLEDGKAEFILKHGQTVTIKDLPAGTIYSVTEQEADQDGYTTSVTGDSGMLTDKGAVVTFVNTKNGNNNGNGGLTGHSPSSGSVTRPVSGPGPGVAPVPETEPANDVIYPIYNVPATGDRSSMTIWLALMVVSAIGCVGLLIYKKKGKHES